jgi:hypothetical protein
MEFVDFKFPMRESQNRHHFGEQQVLNGRRAAPDAARCMLRKDRRIRRQFRQKPKDIAREESAAVEGNVVFGNLPGCLGPRGLDLRRL